MKIPLNVQSESFGAIQGGGFIGPNSSPGMDGFARAGRNNKRRVNEAMRLYCDAIQGKVDPLMLREAISPRTPYIVNELARRYPGIYGDPGGRQMGLRETMSVTDYQALYVDVLDRLYYGYYNEWPISELEIVRKHTLRDFRLVSRYLLDGIVGPVTAVDPAAPPQQRALSGPVPQDSATYPTTNTAPIQYQPLLYQVMASINWRAFVNDDLGIFADVAKRLAMSIRMSLSQYITTFVVQASGLNTTLYSSGYNNIINTANGASVNNPPLGAQGLMDAIKVLSKMKDAAGNPIRVQGRLKLWHGPALTAVANNLRQSIDLQVSVEGGSQNAQGFPTQFLRTNPSWFMDKLDPIMMPWIPIVCTTAGVKDTAWGLTVDPNSVERPATEIGLLQGFETAQLFSKVPNTQRMGGGVDAMMGDFNTLDQDIKAMQVWGGTNIDGRTTCASSGQGI